LLEREKKITRDLLERILVKLGLTNLPTTDLPGLKLVYRAWSKGVPFDNSRKLIHRHLKSSDPLPGSDEIDFFDCWLKWGTGGTCWAGNGALQLLLKELGFNAVRGVATMLVAPHLPPNHGTVVVRFADEDYLVDASILHLEPILLKDKPLPPKTVPWVKELKLEGDKWHINWIPMHRQNLLDCRVDYFPAMEGEFLGYHEKTREWSPFNFELNSRRAFDDKMIGMCFGQHSEVDQQGLRQRPVTKKERDDILVEIVGLHPEFVAMIPDDIPTPPPPGSKTAAASLQDK